VFRELSKWRSVLPDKNENKVKNETKVSILAYSVFLCLLKMQNYISTYFKKANNFKMLVLKNSSSQFSFLFCLWNATMFTPFPSLPSPPFHGRQLVKILRVWKYLTSNNTWVKYWLLSQNWFRILKNFAQLSSGFSCYHTDFPSITENLFLLLSESLQDLLCFQYLKII
jgi:hypothetical protein